MSLRVSRQSITVFKFKRKEKSTRNWRAKFEKYKIKHQVLNTNERMGLRRKFKFNEDWKKIYLKNNKYLESLKNLFKIMKLELP